MYNKCTKTGHFCPAFLGTELEMSSETDRLKKKIRKNLEEV
jgi:hypothetical protein